MTEQTAKLRSQVDRGETARVVLKELEEAFKALEKQCFEVFRASDMHDDAGRKACRFYLKVLDDVQTRFRTFVTTGEAAHKQLASFKEPNKLRRAIGI